MTINISLLKYVKHTKLKLDILCIYIIKKLKKPNVLI